MIKKKLNHKLLKKHKYLKTSLEKHDKTTKKHETFFKSGCRKK
jgi:hypothetical protein